MSYLVTGTFVRMTCFSLAPPLDSHSYPCFASPTTHIYPKMAPIFAHPGVRRRYPCDTLNQHSLPFCRNKALALGIQPHRKKSFSFRISKNASTQLGIPWIFFEMQVNFRILVYVHMCV